MSKYQEDVIYNDKLRVVVCLKTSEVTKRMSKTFRGKVLHIYYAVKEKCMKKIKFCRRSIVFNVLVV